MKFRKIEQTGSGEGSGSFLKLKRGEPVKGICRGELCEFKIKWIDGKSHVVEKNTPGAKSRFRINFLTTENGKTSMKIWEFGISIQNQLFELSTEYDLAKTMIKITRHGEKLETTYAIIPILKQEETTALLTKGKDLPLHMLEPKQTQKSEESPFPEQEFPTDNSDDLPF